MFEIYTNLFKHMYFNNYTKIDFKQIKIITFNTYEIIILKQNKIYNINLNHI